MRPPFVISRGRELIKPELVISGEVVDVPVITTERGLVNENMTANQVDRDRWCQNFIVHADFWLGIICVVTSGVYGLHAFDLITLSMIGLYSIFTVSNVAALWLLVLGLLTGLLYKTNQGTGVPNLDGVTATPVDPLAQHKQAVNTGGGRIRRILMLAVIEGILLIIGMFVDGYWQILLGCLGLMILTLGVINEVNEIEVNNVVNAELQRLAAGRPEAYREVAEHNDRVAAETKALPRHLQNNKRRRARYGARKRMQMAVLTFTDFFLFGSCVLCSFVMDQNSPIIQTCVTFIFFATGAWMIFLGKVTGHGDPGSHEHPFYEMTGQELAK